MNATFHQILRDHWHDDVQQLALQRNRYPQLSDADFRFLLQQLEGRQKTKDKLPTFAQIHDWWYPVRLSCEQCSSEATARYKAQLIQTKFCSTFIDLTGGYGIDSFFLSEHIKEAHYVERNPELCAIAEHNFSLYRPHIQVHNTTAEDFLSSHILPTELSSNCLIFLDPARRSHSGNKVFRIEDCEPNIISILPLLRNTAKWIMIKFSPMLDITAALRAMGNDWDTHIVATNNEVKEVLFFTGNGLIHAIDIHAMHTDTFTFTEQEEKNARITIAPQIQKYIYEPNAAIIKSGAFRLICERYESFQKLDKNTHLYTSDILLKHFPGRIWQVEESISKHSYLDPKLKYSIISRNYPLTPDQIRKKYKLHDGNDAYLIGARLAGRPTLFLCRRM